MIGTENPGSFFLGFHKRAFRGMKVVKASHLAHVRDDGLLPKDLQVEWVKATDALRFDPDHLTATAGVIHIVQDNTGATTHSFVIDGQNFKLTNDDSGDIDLAAGDYVFYCDVPGHRAAGMEGTLTVEP